MQLLPGAPRLHWTAFGAPTPLLQDRETSAYLRQSRGGLVRHYLARDEREHVSAWQLLGAAGGIEEIRDVMRRLPKQLDGVPQMLVDNGIWKDRTSTRAVRGRMIRR